AQYLGEVGTGSNGHGTLSVIHIGRHQQRLRFCWSQTGRADQVKLKSGIDSSIASLNGNQIRPRHPQIVRNGNSVVPFESTIFVNLIDHLSSVHPQSKIVVYGNLSLNTCRSRRQRDELAQIDDTLDREKRLSDQWTALGTGASNHIRE